MICYFIPTVDFYYSERLDVNLDEAGNSPHLFRHTRRPNMPVKGTRHFRGSYHSVGTEWGVRVVPNKAGAAGKNPLDQVRSATVSGRYHRPCVSRKRGRVGRLCRRVVPGQAGGNPLPELLFGAWHGLFSGHSSPGVCPSSHIGQLSINHRHRNPRSGRRCT
jgi:hypothetical protein